jgi:hypothetical protein
MINISQTIKVVLANVKKSNIDTLALDPLTPNSIARKSTMQLIFLPNMNAPFQK